MTDSPTPTPTIEQTRELAGDLICALTPHVGDPRGVSDVLCHWLDTLDASVLNLVCAAAVQTVFAKCLTRVPVEQVPPGALTFTTTDGATK